MSPHATKPFYSSQVHPTYLPTLHKSGRIEKKLALGIVAAAGIGYGLQKYKESRQSSSSLPMSSSSLPLAASQAQSPASPSLSEQQQQEQQRTMSAEEFRRRQEHVALMDAYGDRSSLDSLEAAIRAYSGSRNE